MAIQDMEKCFLTFAVTCSSIILLLWRSGRYAKFPSMHTPKPTTICMAISQTCL